jgi:(2R)-3-sulfolactate dehydrogenase (NADP+)
LQQVDGAIALDKGARMPGQGRREQDPVELENTVWELTLTLAGLK